MEAMGGSGLAAVGGWGLGTVGGAGAARRELEASSAVAKFRSTQKTEIQIVTRDGDRVSLSLKTREGFDARGGSLVGLQGAAAYAAVSSFSDTRFRMDVQGQLDEGELAAIGEVLGRLDELAGRFYGGEDVAAPDALAIGFDAGELAGLSFRLSERQSFDYRAALLSSGAPG